jgi:hypothetical protein
MIAADHGQVSAERRDAVAYLWAVQRGEETRRITVYVSGPAMASDDRGLSDEVVAAKNTRGRSVLSTLGGLDDPPRGHGWHRRDQPNAPELNVESQGAPKAGPSAMRALTAPSWGVRRRK